MPKKQKAIFNPIYLFLAFVVLFVVYYVFTSAPLSFTNGFISITLSIIGGIFLKKGIGA